jgi:hypothetical protein
MEDFLIELRYLLIKKGGEASPPIEDFLIEPRYFLIKKKRGEAPPPHGGLPQITQVLPDKKKRGEAPPHMEDFLIELRYLLIKKGGEAPLPSWRASS